MIPLRELRLLSSKLPAQDFIPENHRTGIQTQVGLILEFDSQPLRYIPSCNHFSPHENTPNPLVIEKRNKMWESHSQLLIFPPQSCLAFTRRRQDITLALTLSTEGGVKIFLKLEIFSRIIQMWKKKKNPKCLMPLFSCLAKCAFS